MFEPASQEIAGRQRHPFFLPVTVIFVEEDDFVGSDRTQSLVRNRSSDQIPSQIAGDRNAVRIAFLNADVPVHSAQTIDQRMALRFRHRRRHKQLFISAQCSATSWWRHTWWLDHTRYRMTGSEVRGSLVSVNCVPCSWSLRSVAARIIIRRPPLQRRAVESSWDILYLETRRMSPMLPAPSRHLISLSRAVLFDFRQPLWQMIAFAIHANSVQAGSGSDVEQTGIFASAKSDVRRYLSGNICQLFSIR